MNTKRNNRILWLTLVVGCLFGQTGIAQLTDQCQLLGTSSSEVSAALPSATVKSGLDFNLTISVPGINCGDYTVTITTSDNLLLSTVSGSFPIIFTPTGTNQFENATTISSTNGLNFPIPFKFKPGTTCNNETGTFEIVVQTICDGEQKACTLNVSIKAIAQNYWKVEKKHIWGNYSGGVILWRIRLWQPSNPSLGVGDLNIHSGTLADVVTCNAGTCDEHILSVTNASGVTGIGTATANWNTGTIPSTTYHVDYYVTTTSCDPSGTIVENCISYDFCLGIFKSNIPDDKKSKLQTDSPELPSFGNCCERIHGTVCDNVTLTDIPSATTNFIKQRVSSSQLNYAQNCEGQYRIDIGNTGNTPLTNLVMNDQIPFGINVTRIDVLAPSGLTWDASLSGGQWSGNHSFTGLNLSNPYLFTWTSAGPLLNESIVIKITFTITAPASTNINNCAILDYEGTYSGWANICGISIPPDVSGHKESCAPFNVEPPKAIPGLKKCIRTNQQTYNIDDCIPFRIVVSNHGQSNLSGYTLSDILSSPQSLEICGPISYAHGVGSFQYDPPYTSCISMPTVPGSPPSWLTPLNVGIGSQNPSWVINGMPGECHLDQAYYLVIEFDAKVKPTTFGQYSNCAKLTGALTLQSCTPYNIVRIGELKIQKLVNSGPGTSFGTLGYVNPGESFAFKLVVHNIGSVQLNSIDMIDALPSCVTFTSATGVVHSSSGNVAVTVGAPPNLTLSPLVNLQPGEDLEITINCIRNAGDPSYQCCNDPASVVGMTADIPMTVHANSGPACVVKTVCCDLENLNVTISNGIQYLGAQYVNLNLGITAGNLPIQEVNVTLIDYDYQYNYSDCRPLNIGNLTSHLSTSTPIIAGGLTLAAPNQASNNSLLWQMGTPVNLTGGTIIKLQLWRPWILNIPCCQGIMYYCFKVILKDVNCNVCEKIICFQSVLPRKPFWKNPSMKALHEKNSLEQSGKQIDVLMNPEEINPEDLHSGDTSKKNTDKEKGDSGNQGKNQSGKKK